MKKYLSLTALVFLHSWMLAQTIPTPDKIYSSLFTEVQLQRIFPDGKTFVDMVPKRNPKDIMYDYGLQKGPRFDLKKFVEDNFELPHSPQLNYITQEKDVTAHIRNLWAVLKREADKPLEGSSLLPLPNPYIVPGGRFREVYYWDSYFTMLGLRESGETELIENMIRNFAFLIDTYGHIPNGNRSYYLTRSQPPFFALMVELLAGVKSDEVYKTYLPQLEKEYAFWMEGSDKLKTGIPYRRVVKLADGAILNRYWDDNTVPRQESWREDLETAEKSGRNKIEMYQHLRAGAESGWDFSSRWLKDSKTLTTIQTTDYIPVDLNSLLYKLELVIARGKFMSNDEAGRSRFTALAEKRKSAVNKFCWNKNLKYYTDYNFRTRKQAALVSPAGMYPFCLFQGNSGYMSLLARQAADAVRTQLLQPGGIQTTSNNTGQQWDAPNGWAPLQWMTIWGLDRCGQRELARDIAKRWIKLNTDVFQRTGKLMEKYNVTDLHLDAGGGEYPSQDGFGWTNGVLLALIKKYGAE